MSEDGDTKDDVRMPDGEIGEKITRLFKVEEKDTSELTCPVLPLRNFFLSDAFHFHDWIHSLYLCTFVNANIPLYRHRYSYCHG